MFYLTYRPKTFKDLDNTHVRDSLTQILESKNLPHAFLFTGQKGTGKTSTGRILAKAVNCETNAFAGKKKDIEPCNTCSSCKDIAAGSSPDVVEMDAASNRGIEEVRTLIRNAAYAPMMSRYKVYIIDEAHMITNDAFNALLKTLEEPPPSTIFILATTNEEKIPKTIISRCVRVHFGKAKKTDILQMIHRIADKEKVTISPELMDLIATHADHSFRDATKILEELIIHNKLTPEEAQQYLGLAKRDLLTIIKKKELKEALAWVESFSETGGNMKTLLEELLEQLHQQLRIKNGLGEDPTEEDIGFTMFELARAMKLLSEAYTNLRNSPIDTIPLEIALIEFYNTRTNT